jgi:hypothetical protein
MGIIARCTAAMALVLVMAAPASYATDDVEARGQFLESRLDERRDSIVLWQDGWTGIYGAALAFHGVRTVTNSDNDDQVANGVSALRALTAIALMRARPHPGRQGAEPMRAAGPPGSPERLEAGEAVLAASARRAGRARTLRRHLANVGANLVFGGMILAFGEPDDALVSTLLGIAGGEAVLLTAPQGPVADHAAYRSRFAHARTGLRWEWSPWIGPEASGLVVRGRF